MALITRISRLFKADFHAALDALEEPQQILRQAIREMQEIVDTEQQRLQWLQQETAQLQQRQQDLQQARSRIQEELDFCFDAEQPDLAKSLLRQRLENEALEQWAQRREQVISGEAQRVHTDLQLKLQRLQSMQEKAEIFSHHNAAGDAAAEDGVHVTDEMVEIAFLREQQRRREL